MHGEHPRRPALLVELLGLQELLDQADLVVDVEDGEVVLQADQLGMAAQDLDADRVEGAEPGHALDDLADHLADALLHLARRLVGEGDGEDFARLRAAEVEDMGDAGGQHPGLAGSGAGQHQHRAVQRLHRLALLGVEIGEIGRGARAPCARAAMPPAPAAGPWSRIVTLGLGHVDPGQWAGGNTDKCFIAKMALMDAIFEAVLPACLPLCADLALIFHEKNSTGGTPVRIERQGGAGDRRRPRYRPRYRARLCARGRPCRHQ